MAEFVTHDLDSLMKTLGDFGRYQGWQYTLHFLASLTSGIHMISLVTVAAIPDYRCEIPGENGTMLYRNESILRKHIPYSEAKRKFDSCSLFNDTSQTAYKCDKFVYDDTYYKTTFATEWKFFCDQRWMGAVAQSAYMFGVFTGAAVLGNMADKYGRKPIFCWSAILQLILGVGVAFTPEYNSFIVIRYFFGIFASAGCFLPAFVLTMELVGPKKRSICGLSMHTGIAIGMMLVPAWAAVISNGKMLQILYGFHAVILLPHIWFMDESIRWLWSNGRIEEATKTVEKALKINKIPTDIGFTQFMNNNKHSNNIQKQQEAKMMDLFQYPRLRSMILIICLSWFASSLTFYGLSLNTGNMQGNPFINLFLIILVEVPAYLISAYIMEKLGRRSILSFSLIMASFWCVAAALSSVKVVSTVLVLIGKFFISCSFGVTYNYTAELFPTTVRNSAVGLGSMSAKLAGALTPLITLLDSFDPKLPSTLFALVALISGILTLFLPETLHKKMPQDIEDGKNFGIGDTCFTTCINNKKNSGISLEQTVIILQNLGKDKNEEQKLENQETTSD